MSNRVVHPLLAAQELDARLERIVGARVRQERERALDKQILCRFRSIPSQGTLLQRLYSRRADLDAYCRSGPHGAIIHYKATKESNRALGREMYLVDSGGQYLDGTTDITRTTHFGEPSAHEIQCYTRVLQVTSLALCA